MRGDLIAPKRIAGVGVDDLIALVVDDGNLLAVELSAVVVAVRAAQTAEFEVDVIEKIG